MCTPPRFLDNRSVGWLHEEPPDDPIRATIFCLAIAAAFPAAAPVGQPAQPIGAPDPRSALTSTRSSTPCAAAAPTPTRRWPGPISARRGPPGRRLPSARHVRADPRRLRRHHRDEASRVVDGVASIARARRHGHGRQRFELTLEPAPPFRITGLPSKSATMSAERGAAPRRPSTPDDDRGGHDADARRHVQPLVADDTFAGRRADRRETARRSAAAPTAAPIASGRAPTA